MKLTDYDKQVFRRAAWQVPSIVVGFCLFGLQAFVAVWLVQAVISLVNRKDN